MSLSRPMRYGLGLLGLAAGVLVWRLYVEGGIASRGERPLTHEPDQAEVVRFAAAVECSARAQAAGCRRLPVPSGPLRLPVESVFAAAARSDTLLTCTLQWDRRALLRPIQDGFFCSVSVGEIFTAIDLQNDGRVRAFDMSIRSESAGIIFRRAEQEYRRRFGAPGPCHPGYQSLRNEEARFWYAASGLNAAALYLGPDHAAPEGSSRRVLRRIEKLGTSTFCTID